MKWKLIKLFAPLLLLAFVIPMVMPGPNGKPVMTWRNWMPAAATMQRWQTVALKQWHALTASIEKNTGLDVAPEPARLFKWQDANGTWHFTDRAELAPADAIKAQVSNMTNTMAPPPQVHRDQDSAELVSGGGGGLSRSKSAEHVTGGLRLPLPTTVPVDKIPQLIDDAKKLNNLSEEHARQIDDI